MIDCLQIMQAISCSDGCMRIYQQMVSASTRHGMPTCYEADLTRHDRASCEAMKPGENFLWVLRRCGTNLFRLGVCTDPMWITYPLDEDPKSLVWLVQVTRDGGRGDFVSITKDEAPAAATTPTPRRCGWRSAGRG